MYCMYRIYSIEYILCITYIYIYICICMYVYNIPDLFCFHLIFSPLFSPLLAAHMYRFPFIFFPRNLHFELRFDGNTNNATTLSNLSSGQVT